MFLTSKELLNAIKAKFLWDNVQKHRILIFKNFDIVFNIFNHDIDNNQNHRYYP